MLPFRPSSASLLPILQGPGYSADGLDGTEATLLCKAAIASAEAESHIPDLFLSAIGRVESGRALGESGQVTPWPWTIDAEGQGHFFRTKEAAVAAVKTLQARGVRSIDVGCLQVNLLQHPEAFASLEQAFDPRANASFAARLLGSLFQQTGSWPLAAAAYHSQTPALGAPYQQRVLAAWATPDRPVRSRPTHPVPIMAAAPSQAAAGAGPPPLTGFNPEVHSEATAQAGGPPMPHGRDLAAYRRYPVMLAMHTRSRG